MIAILVIFFAVPIAYGLLGIIGLFVLILGFVVTFILALKRKGFPPQGDEIK
jgi:hypothetical protein